MAAIINWTISLDGHYVSDDGYVCPKTFAEYYEMHPDHPQIMASVLLKKHTGSTKDVADLTQSILTSLLEKRTIERFDPARTGGCSKGLFMSYLNLCIRRHYYGCWTNDHKNPAVGAIPVLPQSSVIGPDYLVTLVYVSEFRREVATYDGYWIKGSDLIALLDAVQAEGSYSQAGVRLGLTDSRLRSMAELLRRLARRFANKSTTRPIHRGKQ